MSYNTPTCVDETKILSSPQDVSAWPQKSCQLQNVHEGRVTREVCIKATLFACARKHACFVSRMLSAVIASLQIELCVIICVD